MPVPKERIDRIEHRINRVEEKNDDRSGQRKLTSCKLWISLAGFAAGLVVMFAARQ